PLLSTWQSVQLSPSDAEKNPIVPMNSSTGIPFRIWTFLNASSAICGRSRTGSCIPSTAMANSQMNVFIVWQGSYIQARGTGQFSRTIYDIDARQSQGVLSENISTRAAVRSEDVTPRGFCLSRLESRLSIHS